MPADVVVAGDVCVDLLLTPVPAAPAAATYAWQGVPRVGLTRLLGGSLLLAEMVTRAAGEPVVRQAVDSPDDLPRVGVGRPFGWGRAPDPAPDRWALHSVL